MDLEMDFDHIRACGQSLLEAYPDQRIWAFYAPMGAGKTTLIKAMCSHLGVQDNVSSPTFAIVNEYHRKSAEAVYHFDFYRIESIREAYDIGYDDYFYSGQYCFIEWSEHIEALLDLPHLKVFMEAVDHQTRRLHIEEYHGCN